MATPVISLLASLPPVIEREDAEHISQEFFAYKRENEIREWNPAICGLVAHIVGKVREEGSLRDAFLEKARTAARREDIEVPIFTYTRTSLVGETKPWQPMNQRGEYTNEAGETLSYRFTTTVGDASRAEETTISSLDDWTGGDIPLAQKYMPLRRLLSWDTYALGLLELLLGDNIRCVQRQLPARKENEFYTVHDVQIVAKFFTVKEGQTLPLGETVAREAARRKWFP
jgi:hypothetical protein